MIGAKAVFNRVCRHLLTQMAVSENDESCAYRGEDGRRCAVGVLIRDKHYRPILEGKDVYDLRVRRALSDSGIAVEDALDLLSELQTVHDEADPDEWAGRLREIAEERGFQMPAVPEQSTGGNDG